MPWVDVNSAICETCGVVVFHTSMINWRGAAHLMVQVI